MCMFLELKMCLNMGLEESRPCFQATHPNGMCLKEISTQPIDTSARFHNTLLTTLTQNEVDISHHITSFPMKYDQQKPSQAQFDG